MPQIIFHCTICKKQWTVNEKQQKKVKHCPFCGEKAAENYYWPKKGGGQVNEGDQV